MVRAVLAATAVVVSAAGSAFAQSPSPAAQGHQLYGQFCEQCHGPNMATPGTTAFDLRTFPLDQHERFVGSVTNGKGNMPSWQGVITPAEIELLWAYVQTRGAAK